MNPPTTLHVGPVALPLRAGAPLVVAYLLLYLALDKVSYVDPLGPLGITPWNPPPGLSLFLLLRFGLSMTPWLFVAALAAHVLFRELAAPLPVIAAACAMLTAGYALAAAVLRPRLDPDNGMASLRDATTFTGTATLATLAIALLYVGLFVATGVIARDAMAISVAQFWIGDLIGVVVTTPLLLAATRPRSSPHPVSAWENAAQAAAVLGALWLVFGSGLGEELKLFYVLFLPLVWIAMRRGVAGTTATALVIQIGLIAALQFGGHKPGEVLDFQFLMLALALTGLFLAVVVEERRSAEQRLRDKQFELDRTLRAAAASELASTLAHELNQPLSAIASYTRSCQLLLEHGDPDGELPATMDKVVAEANRAGTVVRRLREFVRSGTLRQRPLAPSLLLAGAAEAARLRALRHGVTIVVDARPDLPEISADRVQLETVLHNLLTNSVDALKTSAGTRTVRLSAAAHDADAVRIVVADDGPGVSPEMAGTLFQPLATSKAQGLGLGLAISRSIVEAHGGRLWLEPSATGAAFCLTLPVAR
ncbi:MAG: MASE1 domain-containing protein [Burkholderiales bacterium]